MKSYKMYYISQLDAIQQTGKSRTTIKNLVKKIKVAEQSNTLDQLWTSTSVPMLTSTDVPLIKYEKNGHREPKILLLQSFVMAYFGIAEPMTSTTSTSASAPMLTSTDEPMTSTTKTITVDFEEITDDLSNDNKQDNQTHTSDKDELIQALKQQINDLIKTKDELIKQSEQNNILLFQQGQRILELTNDNDKPKKWYQIFKTKKAPR